MHRLLLLFPFLGTMLLSAETNAGRQQISLNGDWLFQRNGAPAEQWKTVRVPSSFQSHEGIEWHGIGWYRKELTHFPLPSGKRVLLQFQAAATEAEVWCDGQKLGTHLGGWTPFRFDITDCLKKNPGAPHEIRVRLDEQVGHNTQGFLPIIEPHFGGLWQDVSLLVVPETYFDDLRLMVNGDARTRELRVEVPITGRLALKLGELHLRCRLKGEPVWQDLLPLIQRSNDTLQARVAMPQARLWSPPEPNLYEVEMSLPGKDGDTVRAVIGFRSLEAFGQEFRLNGRPLSIRGVLNWGYSPPSLEPNAGEAAWRAELELARSQGFNLMKFCLWIPPQRYLELADEMGMLTWIEYPTWHPNLTEKYLQPLLREFTEFFQYDRNHPSVILRSLTCETGPSAELKVIQSLYDTAHQMIPGALVEDDSSWIGWNRVHDFYDDHPYGNNHTWVETLAGFNEYILAHGLKPMVLGESISADTWIDREAVLARLGAERPWYAPVVLDDMAGWTDRMRTLAGSGGLDQLRPDSLRYGMLMRKYQIEAYRREVPYGGYVITVLRDVPNCSMGFFDYLGQPKWTSADWAWHNETICLLKTARDRRSFSSAERIRGQILLSQFGLQAIEDGVLEVTLQSATDPGRELQHEQKKGIQQNAGTLAQLLDLDWSAAEASGPTHLIIRASLKDKDREWRNEWPIWVVPPKSPDSLKDVELHSSVAPALATELFPGCGRLDANRRGGIVVASRFDDELVRVLENGGRVLFLPDGQKHSFALSAHWFLRGAPYIPESSITQRVPRDLLLELQHFDLASDVVPNLPQLDSFDPLLMLWDTHDQKQVKTHGLVFETRVGSGRLLVSALRHGGEQNAAGHWLLSALINHLRSGEPPHHALSSEVWGSLKSRLHAEQTNLVSCIWRFKPDPQNEGVAQGWQSPALASEADWKDIRIGAYWESQGYPALDGWAWYRLWVDIPEHWKSGDVFLSFEGVDDMYELYVNGELAGKGGDLATHKDALSEKKSHNIARLVKPGQKALIAVRVDDWQGAGGIFRPVTLGTVGFSPGVTILK
jgi:Glycosyl hydrolases family 2, sugar binding domain/Glycosyl hydrolases family 2